MADENLNETTPTGTTSKAGGNNKMLYILLASVAGVAAVGALAFFLLNKSNTPAPVDDTANLATTGSNPTAVNPDGMSPGLSGVAPGRVKNLVGRGGSGRNGH